MSEPITPFESIEEMERMLEDADLSIIHAPGTIVPFLVNRMEETIRSLFAEREKAIKAGNLLLIASESTWDVLSPEQHAKLNEIVADIQAPDKAKIAQQAEAIEALAKELALTVNDRDHLRAFIAGLPCQHITAPTTCKDVKPRRADWCLPCQYKEGQDEA